MFTERKALEEMFSYLEQDKRTIKAQARQDIENIENRQMQILDRLQRLDQVDREAVDVEGVMQSLAQTAKELTELIPHVPFTSVLERAAEMVAEKNGEQISIGDPAKTVVREKIVEAAKMQKLQTPPDRLDVKPKKERREQVKGLSDKKGIETIIKILGNLSEPVAANELNKLFVASTGIEYTNFYYKLKVWTGKSKGRIIKDEQTKKYYLKEHEKHGELERKETTLV